VEWIGGLPTIVTGWRGKWSRCRLAAGGCIEDGIRRVRPVRLSIGATVNIGHSPARDFITF
jgi:hypothetical protein